MDDKEKKLSLMRYWLLGSYILIFAALITYVGGALRTGLLILSQVHFWIAMVAAAVLAVIWYYIYKWYLNWQE